MTPAVGKTPEPQLSPAMQIAKRAEYTKTIVLAQQLSASALLDPQLPILAYLLTTIGLPHDGDTGVSLAPIDGSASISVSAREVLTAVTTVPSKQLWEDVVSGTMLVGATRLGDMIAQFGFRDSESPLMEFARHFRNACAHGDRWHFVGVEPRFPAATRRVTLSASLHGKKATWTTVSPREYVEYLDELFAHFLTLALHQCIDEAIESSGSREGAAVSNAFYERITANGFPQGNKEYILKVTEALFIDPDFRPVILPNSYDASTSGGIS